MVNAIWVLPQGMGSSLCRASKGQGACWAVIGERFRFFQFGIYPFREQWRPGLACLLFISLYVASTIRSWWKPWLIAAWIAIPMGAIMLLRGGILGLATVPTEFWGGLPLTFVLSTVGFAVAFPLAVALALGRRIADASHPYGQHRLYRVDSRRANHHLSVHRGGDVSSVRAAKLHGR